MATINELTKEQVEKQIKDGRISARDAFHLATTPKDWLIITPGKVWATNNLTGTMKRIIPELDPEITADQVRIINVKKCRL